MTLGRLGKPGLHRAVCLGGGARPRRHLVQGKDEHVTKEQTDALREHLLYLLRGGGAHLGFEKAVAGLPPELRGAKPAGQPHTPWRLLEHLRIAQWDILEFTRDARHESPDWPAGYWPEGDAPPDADAWG